MRIDEIRRLVGEAILSIEDHVAETGQGEEPCGHLNDGWQRFKTVQDLLQTDEITEKEAA